MAVLHDIQCVNPSCGMIEYDTAVQPERLGSCTRCGSAMEICFSTRRAPVFAAVHSRERTVVWYNPKTDKTAYPGRNDVPMPARYANNGYERREFTDLKSLDKFCVKNKVVNEKASFDNSGHADDL